jgi:sugar/nucleoside kinase (ribokinase family)
MKYDVCGIGNLLVDSLIRVDDSFLHNLGLVKGDMKLVDENELGNIMSNLKDLQLAAGGSVGNTLVTLASFGYKIALCGCVGEDEYGDFYDKDLKLHNIHSSIVKKKAKTGQALIFITPDCQRTFITYLGAAAMLSVDDINDEAIKQSRYLYLSGYELLNTEVAMHALKVAKENNVKIVVDLAGPQVIQHNREYFRNIVKKYATVILGNEKEAHCLMSMETIDALDEMAKYVNVAIVTRSQHGSLIKSGGNLYEIPSTKVEAVDTTGAGDLYAAGILYGLLSGKDLYTTGRIASIISAKIVEKIGARFTDQEIQNIKNLIGLL